MIFARASMNTLSKQFGKRVRQIRLDKTLSQGDIARRLKLHRSYISGIERGVRNPSLGVVEKIAKALGVSVHELLK
jgi:transcriptional regulator with XRE-family HTH domain